jgi:hypothetical protein
MADFNKEHNQSPPAERAADYASSTKALLVADEAAEDFCPLSHAEPRSFRLLFAL